MKKGAAIVLGKLSLLGAFYLGHVYTHEIDKFILNTFEKRTPVKSCMYQNIADLKIYNEKESGNFVPKYGVEGRKIEIAHDMAPLDMYSLLERRIKNDYNNDAQKIFSLLHTVLSAHAIGSYEKEELLKGIDSVYGKIDPDREKEKKVINIFDAIKMYVNGEKNAQSN